MKQTNPWLFPQELFPQRVVLRRTRVYIAGPITLGDTHRHCREAMQAWRDLWRAGYWPACPHWSALQAMSFPVDYDEWLVYDMTWLEMCDVMYRVPGESKGADVEEARFVELGRPVYRDLCSLMASVSPIREELCSKT